MSRYRVVNSRQSQVDGAGRLLAPGGGGGDYVLPAATRTTRGGIRVGANLLVVGDLLSAVDMRYDDAELQADVADINAQIQEIIDIIEDGGGSDPALALRVAELEAWGQAVDMDLADLRGNVNALGDDLTAGLDTKQDLLVSGENIKTVGGQSILGSGDIPVGGGGGGNGVVPAEPSTAVMRGSIGEAFVKTGVGEDSVVNRGLLGQQMALMETIAVQQNRTPVVDRNPSLSAAGVSGTYRTSRLSPSSDMRLVTFPTLTFTVTTEVPAGSLLFRLQAGAGSSGFTTLVTTGFAVNTISGVPIGVRTANFSSERINVFSRGVLAPGPYEIDLFPGIFAWTALPA